MTSSPLRSAPRVAVRALRRSLGFVALGIGISASILACESEKFCAAGSVECSGGSTASGTAGVGGASAAGGGGSSGGSGDQGGTSGGSPASGGSSAGSYAGAGASSSSGGSSGEAGRDSGSGGVAGESGVGGEDGEGGAGGSSDTCDVSLSPSEESCLVSDEHAIFVSPVGDDEANGTQAQPVQTLRLALALGREQHKIVIACSTEGPFQQALSVESQLDGARLYGGFACETWEHLDENVTETVSPDPIALRVDGLTAGLVIEDFSFTAADATVLGGSSMGAFVTESANVVLRGVVLTAGSGAPGADGTGTATLAESGAPGNNGTAACSAANQPNAGAAAVETACDGTPSGSIGGKGGDGGNDGNKGGDGEYGLPHLGAGRGGDGEPVSGTWSCANGRGVDGHNGEPGASGEGGIGAGVLTLDGYAGPSGMPGERGKPGQGGGGGGGAKAPVAACTIALNPRTGASGGSGGGGGCGGKGGTGGQGGGASIALASVESEILLVRVQLYAADGGAGGDGGTAQPGGSGGIWGEPASGGLASPSCAGGAGGKGGNGGFGGGGAGGPSIGIAFVGAMPVQSNVHIEIAETPAPGGTDGAGSSTGEGAGRAGVLAAVRDL